MKSILTKILSLCLAVVLFSSSVQLQAAVTTYHNEYSSNGILTKTTQIQNGVLAIKGEAVAYENAVVRVTLYDSAGRAVSGTDENGNSFSYTYDSFGNMSSAMSYQQQDDGTYVPMLTQFVRVLDKDGNSIGTLGFTFKNRTTAYSEADFKNGIQEALTKINDPNVKPQDPTARLGATNKTIQEKDAAGNVTGTFQASGYQPYDTSGGYNMQSAFSDLVGITCTAKVLMAVFGSPENLAKIFQFATANQTAYDKAFETAAKQAQANAEADAESKAATTAVGSTATGTGTASQSYTEIIEDPVKFANEIWSSLSNPNASVTINFGSDGSVTSVSVQLPMGDKKVFTPDVQNATATANCTATAAGTLAPSTGGDPLVSGQITSGDNLITIPDANGVPHYYIAVKADTIDMHDGNGNVPFDGEDIYIDLGTDMASAQETLKAMSAEGSVAISGDAIQNVTGQDGKEHKAMKINAGGFATGANATEAASNWKAHVEGTVWYQNMMTTMTSFWANTIVTNFDEGWKKLVEASLGKS